MKAVVKMSKLNGMVCAPKSKSILHRYLICKYLAGFFEFDTSEFCDDVKITFDALTNLAISENLFMGESASSFRFLLPISLALGLKKTFVLGDALSRRPIDFVINSLSNHGVNIEVNGRKVITYGKLQPGKYIVDASFSSQLISGLLFALPLLDGDSEIVIEGDFVSKQYVSITIETLSKFGICIQSLENKYFIKGNQKYIDTSFNIPGDYSSIAYFSVLNKLGSNIIINGISNEIIQGDSKIDLFLNSTGSVFDMEDNIDLSPIISAYVAAKGRAASLININPLKYKESNRISEINELLDSFSIKSDYKEDNNGTILIYSGQIETKKEFSSKDHRMLMSGLVLSTLVGGTINGVEYIKKSYPNFIKDLINLGANICLID